MRGRKRARAVHGRRRKGGRKHHGGGAACRAGIGLSARCGRACGICWLFSFRRQQGCISRFVLTKTAAFCRFADTKSFIFAVSPPPTAFRAPSAVHFRRQYRCFRRRVGKHLRQIRATSTSLPARRRLYFAPTHAMFRPRSAMKPAPRSLRAPLVAADGARFCRLCHARARHATRPARTARGASRC